MVGFPFSGKVFELAVSVVQDSDQDHDHDDDEDREAREHEQATTI
jgi:hypothetical protein